MAAMTVDPMGSADKLGWSAPRVVRRSTPLADGSHGQAPHEGARARVQRDLDRLEEVTGQIVGRMFFGTMLKSMRESSLNSTIGHGGRGEEVFSAQLHGILAERMGAATQGGLKTKVFSTMSRQQELISELQHGRAKVK